MELSVLPKGCSFRLVVNLAGHVMQRTDNWWNIRVTEGAGYREMGLEVGEDH